MQMSYEGMIAEIQRLTEMIGTLVSTVETLQQKIDEQNKRMEEKDQLLSQKEAEIAELKRRLGMNSGNSSKPPSSDGYGKKPAPKSLRGKSDKKSGGQKGHEGKNLAQATPNHVIGCMPSQCAGCPRRGECQEEAEVLERRQVFDAVVKIEITEYDKLRVKSCPLHGWTQRNGSFPDDIKAAVQYGTNFVALVVALNTVGAVSISRTREIIANLFNVPLSEGTITAMVSRCSGNITDVLPRIGKFVVDGDVANADETGLRVEGKLHWAHVLCNGFYTLITLSKMRGWKGMQEIGWLPQFHGVLEHDCWAPYWNAPDITHAVCCAHLLRELTAIEENHPEYTWPKAFKKLLLEMKRVRDRAVEQGKQELSYYYLHKFDLMFDRLIDLAYKETPEPPLKPGNKQRGRRPRGKALALVDRLKKLKGAVCLFIRNFQVPFDNNQAERDLRMVKAKVKVSGCFRTEKGAQEYLNIMSFVSTAKKLGSNAYEAIWHAVTGTPDYIFAGAAE